MQKAFYKIKIRFEFNLLSFSLSTAIQFDSFLISYQLRMVINADDHLHVDNNVMRQKEWSKRMEKYVKKKLYIKRHIIYTLYV